MLSSISFNVIIHVDVLRENVLRAAKRPLHVYRTWGNGKTSDRLRMPRRIPTDESPTRESSAI